MLGAKPPFLSATGTLMRSRDYVLVSVVLFLSASTNGFLAGLYILAGL
jgi:hypothetical protein